MSAVVKPVVSMFNCSAAVRSFYSVRSIPDIYIYSSADIQGMTTDSKPSIMLETSCTQSPCPVHCYVEVCSALSDLCILSSYHVILPPLLIANSTLHLLLLDLPTSSAPVLSPLFPSLLLSSSFVSLSFLLAFLLRVAAHADIVLKERGWYLRQQLIAPIYIHSPVFRSRDLFSVSFF